ncbi:M42 family metallopeptidase [Paenibacillus sp.]|uniref:M42 family metallopeptidase n=1 Tax=Paenibacillus sp. TaxID=58172 RepID=UPI002D3F7D89|nr:M42 family metallopeptidase [Paenibacillus sp.]HZG55467.1 M42 family metallopeptidase [Paenibacillus sp.]
MTDPRSHGGAPPAYDREYTLGLLKRLLNTPSPTGFTHDIMALLDAEAARLGYRMERIAKGGGVVTVRGTAPDAPGLAVSAHVDTLGAMVRSANADGTLRLSIVGGYMMQSIENEYCLVHTRGGAVYSGTILPAKPSVHVYEDARDQKREESNYVVRLDEAVSSKDDVGRLGIGAGDYISFDPRAVFLDNGYIKSRHLDDKAGVAAVFALLEAMSRTGTRPRRDVTILISNYEEIGHGSSYVPGGAEELLAVDMGAIGDDLGCTERDVSICAKDSTGPYDYGMTNRLIAHAKRLGLTYAVDIYPRYGSDASAALRGGQNVRAALIGPGVHASHGMERTHEDAIRQTYMLLAAYALE